jgi:hypothetical protein
VESDVSLLTPVQLTAKHARDVARERIDGTGIGLARRRADRREDAGPIASRA